MTLTFYMDDGSQEAAEHNVECLRLRSWQQGTPLPAMTSWEWKAWDRTDPDLALEDSKLMSSVADRG